MIKLARYEIDRRSATKLLDSAEAEPLLILKQTTDSMIFLTVTLKYFDSKLEQGL